MINRRGKVVGVRKVGWIRYRDQCCEKGEVFAAFDGYWGVPRDVRIKDVLRGKVIPETQVIGNLAHYRHSRDWWMLTYDSGDRIIVRMKLPTLYRLWLEQRFRFPTKESLDEAQKAYRRQRTAFKRHVYEEKNQPMKRKTKRK